MNARDRGLELYLSLFFLFDLAHQRLGLIILSGHDEAHAQIGQYDCSDVENLSREVPVHRNMKCEPQTLSYCFLTAGS